MARRLPANDEPYSVDDRPWGIDVPGVDQHPVHRNQSDRPTASPRSAVDPQLIVGRLTYVVWFVVCLVIVALCVRGSRRPVEDEGRLSVDEWVCVGALLALPLAVLVSFVEGGPSV